MRLLKFFLSLSVLFSLACIQIPTLDELILRPNNAIGITPADAGYVYTEIVLPINENRSIVVWHVQTENPKALVIVYPGSDANKGRYVEGLQVFVPYGYDVLLIDYEGFGNSPGTPSLQNCLDDAYVATEFGLTLNQRVIGFSASLGTPLLARVAADLELTGCIFEGTLILKEEAELWLQDAQLAFPLFVWAGTEFISGQTPEGYDILKYIQNVDEPKLFQHSVEDEVTPFAGGLKVFETAPEPKEFWEMRGEHGKMVRIATEEYVAHTQEWLNKIISNETP